MSVNFEQFEEASCIYEEFRQFSQELDSTKTAALNEDSLYIEPQTGADSRKESVIELEANINANPPMARAEQGAYLGIMTLKDAERKVTKAGQFAVYHRMPIALATKLCSSRLQVLEYLEPSPSLYLNVVYLHSSGQYQHYPIIEVIHDDKKFYQVLTTHSTSEERVSKKRSKLQHEKEPRFLSIEKLLDHYTKFAYGYRFDENGGIEVDVFPPVKH